MEGKRYIYILLLYTYMCILRYSSICAYMRAYIHVCVIYIYIYTKKKLSMCGVQRVKGVEPPRTCYVKCRCCSF